MKLPRLTALEVARILERLGFAHTHTTGSHMVFKQPDGRKTVVPYHAGEEIGTGLLLKIIKKDLGMSKEEFEQLVR